MCQWAPPPCSRASGATGWARLARRAVGRHGVVTVRWTVAKGMAIGPISLRLAVRRRGRVLVASTPAPSAIGSAYVPCSRPSPPSRVPSGDGWITGGVYGEGGAFPGMDACLSQRYTIEALDSGGSVAARETVSGGHSYTLVDAVRQLHADERRLSGSGDGESWPADQSQHLLPLPLRCRAAPVRRLRAQTVPARFRRAPVAAAPGQRRTG